MKIEDLSYKISLLTLRLLEEKYHYKISEEHKKEIAEKIRRDLDKLLEQ